MPLGATDTLTGEAKAALQARFAAQHAASRAQVDVPLAWRRERLRALRQLLVRHEADLTQAVAADFGVRARQLTLVADLLVLHNLLSSLDRKLPRWMRPQKVPTPWYLQPARAWVQRQPLGVVGVIAPWNYPLQLALAPAAVALAAGNRVMLKPSEHTPRTAALLAELIQAAFDPADLCVLQGGAAVAAQLAQLPLDHLFFTGSGAVGRQVAQAAAANLTPTTLELGGKSPCIVDASANLTAAARQIAHGKLFNAGQTCIAPDYVLLPRGCEAEFEAAFRSAVGELYPYIAGNPDYTSIHSDSDYARLQAMLAEAKAQGAVLKVIAPQGPATAPADAMRQMPPVLVYHATLGMRVLTQEIFGPILPVLSYSSLDEVIDRVNAGPRPLALYWMGTDRHARDQVLRRTVSGGVTVNDTLLHVAHDGLPFGGVGASGWGAYHGETGFLRFTHQKAVLAQSRLNLSRLFYPPYGLRFEQLTRCFKWFV
jgi:coniferyl-aldehyde dehydrogenase